MDMQIVNLICWNTLKGFNLKNPNLYIYIYIYNTSDFFQEKLFQCLLIFVQWENNTVTTEIMLNIQSGQGPELWLYHYCSINYPIKNQLFWLLYDSGFFFKNKYSVSVSGC